MCTFLKSLISIAICFTLAAGEVAQVYAEALPKAFPADLSQARLPVGHVSVQSLHTGSSGVTILHIQDAHANLGGQKSLAAALDELMTRYPVDLVLVEGGSTDVTLDRLKKIGTREQWKRAADRLLYEGLISGEEFLNLTSDHPMRLQGIEQRALYNQSLRVYAAIARHRKETLPYLRRIALAMERVKYQLYPKTLLDYEAAVRPAGASASAAVSGPGEVDFNVRTEKLLELAEGAGVGLADFAAVRELIALKSAEKRDGFQRAQAEKDFLKLDTTALFAETELLEDTVYREILKTDENARMLRVCDRFLGLLQKAYRIRMSSDEFRMLKINEADFSTKLILGFLNSQITRLGYLEDLTPYETALEDARYAIELFYRLVDKRDRAFLKNAQKALDDSGAKVAVLITGGYHTAHLEQLMRARDWSYAVLTPMVQFQADPAKYESLLLAPLQTPAPGSNFGDRSLNSVELSDLSPKFTDDLRQQAAAESMGARFADTLRPFFGGGLTERIMAAAASRMAVRSEHGDALVSSDGGVGGAIRPGSPIYTQEDGLPSKGISSGDDFGIRLRLSAGVRTVDGVTVNTPEVIIGFAGDGAGASLHSREASRAVGQVMTTSLAQSFAQIDSAGWDSAVIRGFLLEAFTKGQTALNEVSRIRTLDDPRHKEYPPATTVVLSVVVGMQLFVLCVGDSRAYLYRRSTKTLERLTADNALASESGWLDSLKSGESFALMAGYQPSPPNISERLVVPGDQIFLVTDGVYGRKDEDGHDPIIPDAELGKMIRGYFKADAVPVDAMRAMVEEIVDRVKTENPNHDDVTVVHTTVPSPSKMVAVGGEPVSLLPVEAGSEPDAVAGLVVPDQAAVVGLPGGLEVKFKRDRGGQVQYEFNVPSGSAIRPYGVNIINPEHEILFGRAPKDGSTDRVEIPERFQGVSGKHFKIMVWLNPDGSFHFKLTQVSGTNPTKISIRASDRAGARMSAKAQNEAGPIQSDGLVTLLDFYRLPAIRTRAVGGGKNRSRIISAGAIPSGRLVVSATSDSFSKQRIRQALRQTLDYIGRLSAPGSDPAPVRIIYPAVGRVALAITKPMERLFKNLALGGIYVSFEGGAQQNSGIVTPEPLAGAQDLLVVRMTNDLENGSGLVEGDSALMVNAKGRELLFLVALTSVFMTAVARTEGKTATDRRRLIEATRQLRSLIMDLQSGEMEADDMAVIQEFSRDTQNPRTLLQRLRQFAAQSKWNLDEAIEIILMTTQATAKSA